MSKYAFVAGVEVNADEQDAMLAEAAGILRAGDLPSIGRNEAGRVISPGFRLAHGRAPFEPIGSDAEGVLIEHFIPDEDPFDPDRRSSDDRWLEKYRYAAVYTYALEQAGWLAELRVTPTNNVIVLARPKETGE